MRQGAGAGFPISASPRGWFIINSPKSPASSSPIRARLNGMNGSRVPVRRPGVVGHSAALSACTPAL